MTDRDRTTVATELLLKELIHRCSNDLQLVVGMLALEARRASHDETRNALDRAAERVGILAHSRSAALRGEQGRLENALNHICVGLNAQAEPRAISVSLHVMDGCEGLDSSTFVPITLAVNELATNAIKYAFSEDRSGHISITMCSKDDLFLITVDDDGLPFPDCPTDRRDGTGLDLIVRLLSSVGGSLLLPAPGTKLFRLVLPRKNDDTTLTGK